MFNKHTIGILGGMGPAATANFLRLLVKEINDFGIREDSNFPKIIMMSLPLEDWDSKGSKNKDSVSTQIKEGLCWLSRNDAEIVAIPCNTVHEFASHDNRVVNIIDAALSECDKESLIGVLCSRQTRDSKLYERPGFNIRYFADQSEVDYVIANAMAGRFEDISELIEQVSGEDVGTVVLGCTELSLCRHRTSYEIPVVDSSLALAHIVVRKLASLR